MDFFKSNIIPGEVIVQLVAFLIVFFTLKAMAWKPLQASLAARRARIQNDFDQIALQRQDIEKLKTEYAALLQKIDDESRKRLTEALEEGRRIAKEIQDKARTESQQTFDKAKQNLELEVAKARLEMRREIADLAISASEHVLKEKLAGGREQETRIMSIIEELEKTL